MNPYKTNNRPGAVTVQRVPNLKLDQSAYERLCQILLYRISRPEIDGALKYNCGHYVHRSPYSCAQLGRQFGLSSVHVSRILQSLRKDPRVATRQYGRVALVRASVPNARGHYLWTHSTFISAPTEPDPYRLALYQLLRDRQYALAQGVSRDFHYRYLAFSRLSVRLGVPRSTLKAMARQLLKHPELAEAPNPDEAPLVKQVFVGETSPLKAMASLRERGGLRLGR